MIKKSVVSSSAFNSLLLSDRTTVILLFSLSCLDCPPSYALGFSDLKMKLFTPISILTLAGTLSSILSLCSVGSSLPLQAEVLFTFQIFNTVCNCKQEVRKPGFVSQCWLGLLVDLSCPQFFLYQEKGKLPTSKASQCLIFLLALKYFSTQVFLKQEFKVPSIVLVMQI